MKKTLYLALTVSAMALGAASTGANAAVNAQPGNSARAAIAPLELIEQANWRGREWRGHRRHQRVCTWRHHRRICWWR